VNLLDYREAPKSWVIYDGTEASSSRATMPDRLWTSTAPTAGVLHIARPEAVALEMHDTQRIVPLFFCGVHLTAPVAVSDGEYQHRPICPACLRQSMSDPTLDEPPAGD
jgi:hypothetical protein